MLKSKMALLRNRYVDFIKYEIRSTVFEFKRA